MNANEPVAIRYGFDGNGYMYLDSGSGSDWASLNKNVDGEFLYTHPVKELALTDEEMKNLIQEYWGDVHIVDPDGYLHEIAFIRAILGKAQEK